MEAVGILEVFGLTAGFVAADAGCKAGNVRIGAMDKNKPANADKLPVPLLVSIKFRGSVEDVKAAMEAGVAGSQQDQRCVFSAYYCASGGGHGEDAGYQRLGKYKPMET